MFKKGSTLEDWSDLMQGGLLPNHMIWVNASSHDDVWSYAKSVLSKGCLMEHEYYDWNSRPQGRVEDWGDLGHGHLIGGHLVASDGYYEWHGKQYLKESKSLYHLCRDDRKKCKDKLSRGGGREVVHISRWRLVNVFMMSEMEYSKKVDAIVKFVELWVPRVPKPVRPPKERKGPEGHGDPTGLDKALEVAKFAKVRKDEKTDRRKEG